MTTQKYKKEGESQEIQGTAQRLETGAGTSEKVAVDQAESSRACRDPEGKRKDSSLPLIMTVQHN